MPKETPRPRKGAYHTRNTALLHRTQEHVYTALVGAAYVNLTSEEYDLYLTKSRKDRLTLFELYWYGEPGMKVKMNPNLQNSGVRQPWSS